MASNRREEVQDAWAEYVPDGKSPWGVKQVVHLHRRAGFAATWDEVQRDVKAGPAAAVDNLLAGKSNAHAPADSSTVATLVFDAAVSSGDVGRLQAAWLYRMLLGPDPLREKLTLLWHDHFATANAKVDDARLMGRQNENLRKHALAKFSRLLNAAVREPALLLYLDAPANRKLHPNENLSRELMELFTLGSGHYSERDVKEAARALTGWTVTYGVFGQNGGAHDAGDKTILGKQGKWTGADLVKILLEHPATAERIATKLSLMYFGENAVSPEALKTLAAGLREHDLDIAWGVGLILKSQLFYAEANIGTRVLGPVDFVIGAARALEMFDPPPATLALADWTARMGQDLFDPPNVGGWPGGRAWLHTRSMVARANYASALMSGADDGPFAPYDPRALPKKYGFGNDRGAVLQFYHRLLFGVDASAEMRQRLGGLGGASEKDTLIMLLSSPEAHLG